MIKIINDLKKKNMFVYKLESSDIPYHNPLLESSAKPMAEAIRKHLPNPILRSKKWTSTSILEDNSKQDILNYAGAEYFAHNMTNPVYFYDKFKNLPSDAIVVEVGPHGVFRKIVSETLESVTYMSLIKKDSNDTNLDNLLSAIKQLYELGINPSIDKLYPPVEFPVSRGTQSIGSLMKWDHSVVHKKKIFPQYLCRSTASDMNMDLDLTITDFRFYLGHCVDGNNIFPATGYLMLAWRAYASSLFKTWNEVPVVWQNVQFRRPVFLDERQTTLLKVTFSRKTGWFSLQDKLFIKPLERYFKLFRKLLFIETLNDLVPQNFVSCLIKN